MLAVTLQAGIEEQRFSFKEEYQRATQHEELQWPFSVLLFAKKERENESNSRDE
jgi:hypothetical protein